MRVLVAGGGQVGFLVAQRLIREGNEVILVESGHERCLELEAQLAATVIKETGPARRNRSGSGPPAPPRTQALKSPWKKRFSNTGPALAATRRRPRSRRT